MADCFKNQKGFLILLPKQHENNSEGCFPEKECNLFFENDLSLRFPCVEYDGKRFEFNLTYFPLQVQPVKYVWSLDMGSLGDAEEGGVSDCIEINENDLSLTIPCVEYGSAQYGFRLNFIQGIMDTPGVFWELDLSTLFEK